MSENKHEYCSAGPSVSASDSHDELVKVLPMSLEDTVDAVDTARQKEQQSSEGDDNSNSQVEASSSKLDNSGASLLANMSRIQALLQTSTGQDAALASIEYLAHALHYLSQSQTYFSSHLALKYLFRRRAEQHGTGNHTASNHPPRAYLLELSSLFGNARYTVRLLGLLNIWADIPEMLRCSSNDRVTLGISALQVLALTGYQLLENIGHLASNGILPKGLIGPKSRIAKFYIWGAKALFVHFVLEFLKLSKEAWHARKAAGAENTPVEGESISGNELEGFENDHNATRTRDWRERAWSTSIWGILCLYWSSGQTIPVVDKASGGLSFLADIFAFRNIWTQTIA